MAGTTKEASGAVQDGPEVKIHGLSGRDVALVVAVGLTLILCSAGGLGVFLILDTLATNCFAGGGVL
jgi:hypothetical protein